MAKVEDWTNAELVEHARKQSALIAGQVREYPGADAIELMPKFAALVSGTLEELAKRAEDGRLG